MSKYVFTDEMAEISGFGGNYEAACRRMIVAGLEWLDSHPEADPKFHGYKDVFGILTEDNDDAKALSNAITKDEPDITGAMHQAAIQHIIWIKKNNKEGKSGWERYVEVKTKQKIEEDSNA